MNLAGLIPHTREEIIELLILARKKASDAVYRKWIQTLPCCVCGEFAEYVDGEGRNHAAHVSRAAERGVGCKAEYACVPLCAFCHSAQHNGNEAAPFRRIAQLIPVTIAKEKFDSFRVKYLKGWLES